MTAIQEAVILMAGSGSRLRGFQKNVPKPLVMIRGRPLISYTLEALVRAGISQASIVVGYEKERLTEAVRRLAPAELALSFIENPDWQKQNGISLLAAAKHINTDFLLTMADHLFDQSIVDLMVESTDAGVLNVAIDRKLNCIFDLDDAMKVQTQGDRIVAIGKELQDYDAVDTGLFVCPLDIFDYLERVKRDGDCSLADGVRSMAVGRRARTIDIGQAWWQDIDTPEMLAQAEKHLRVRVRPYDPTTADTGS